ncbi:sulfotransferase family protein [Gracilibacillus halophilus YIM-C55.5]|uniref:Sulfotransferase family protein n=1 Tax=Gracilibacillus halophilus YIM-C55.5 TaxID=1308866 RepID=N4WVH5_9BACI|nr:sulfotransferase domain-containing protein [Gracilibacillus halophilus]ENH98400.1 sulfotransferase family protein [Gracilibacillus halophilus YIM-C55.5]
MNNSFFTTRKPDFMIIGQGKCGTTSLFNYIRKYAKNFVSPKQKEIYFFSDLYDNGLNYYERFFPFKIKPQDVTGEATPQYLFHPLSAKRIAETYPNIKLIVMLRNPIDRAYSHYNFINNSNKTVGFDYLSFEEAIKTEDKRLAGELEKVLNTGKYTYKYKYYSYLTQGIYYKQLINWFNHFPREQFLILKSEDFFVNPNMVLKRVFNFLNLNFKNNTEYIYRVYNQTDYEKINPRTREFLKEYFFEYNKKLSQLVGINFNI